MSDLTVALCGFALDGHIAALSQALTRRGATPLVLLPLPWGRYAWRDGRYFYAHESLDHVAAFFVRQTYVPIFDLIHRQAEAVDPVDWLLETVRMQNNASFLQAFFNHFERRGCFLANPFSAGERTKHRQAEIAVSCGWPVAKMFITNSPAEAFAAVSESNGEGGLVMKPPAGGALVRKIDDAMIRAFAAIDCPIGIQEYVPGEDVRVYVIDGDVVAAGRIETGELDYRRDPNYMDRIHQIELPPDVRRNTAAVFERLRLVCGSMDLRLTPAGELVFLEVNSGGSFLELQKGLGIPIADRLAELLVARAQRVALPRSEPETLPLAAVVASSVDGAEQLFDVEAGLESLRMAVRAQVPQSPSIEIDLDDAQQQSLHATLGIHARRARLDLMTHVLVPIPDVEPPARGV
jgi:glutathione synthase/RimK-type ligase-like ATP-grasp enzyme